MKLLLLSDLQGINYEDWRNLLSMDSVQYDATILLGDIEDLLLKSIKEHLSKKPLFGILGNHDYEGDLEYFEIENVHGREITMGDMRFAGLKGSVRYKAGDFPMLTQNEASLYCRSFDDVDILISHNSPKGIHDKPDIAHEGFEGLLEYIRDHQPKYAIHGHQHMNISTWVGETQVIGIYGGILLDTKTGERKHLLRIGE